MFDGGLHVTTRAICVPFNLTLSACTDPDAKIQYNILSLVIDDEASKSIHQTHLYLQTVSSQNVDSPVVPNIVLTVPALLLTKDQTSTSYLVPGLSTGVVYCLCVAVLSTVLLQPPGDPLDGLSRYLS